MATLIVTVLFGLIIAYFAIQNTAVISLHFLNYQISGVPTYIVVVGSLLVGLFLSWIISFVNNIATGFAMRGKDIKSKKQIEAIFASKEFEDFDAINVMPLIYDEKEA